MIKQETKTGYCGDVYISNEYPFLKIYDSRNELLINIPINDKNGVEIANELADMVSSVLRGYPNEEYYKGKCRRMQAYVIIVTTLILFLLATKYLH